MKMTNGKQFNKGFKFNTFIMFIKVDKIKKLICLCYCVGCINLVPLYLYASTVIDNIDVSLNTQKDESNAITNNNEIMSALESYPSFNRIRSAIESQGGFLNPIVSKSFDNSNMYGFELEGNENNKLNFPTILRKKVEDAKYYLLCNVIKTNNAGDNKILPLFIAVVKYKTMDIPVVALTDGHAALIIDLNNKRMLIKKMRPGNKFLNSQYNISWSKVTSFIKCLLETLGTDLKNLGTDLKNWGSWINIICELYEGYGTGRELYLLAVSLTSCPSACGPTCLLTIIEIGAFVDCNAADFVTCIYQ